MPRHEELTDAPEPDEAELAHLMKIRHEDELRERAMVEEHIRHERAEWLQDFNEGQRGAA